MRASLLLVAVLLLAACSSSSGPTPPPSAGSETFAIKNDVSVHSHVFKITIQTRGHACMLELPPGQITLDYGESWTGEISRDTSGGCSGSDADFALYISSFFGSASASWVWAPREGWKIDDKREADGLCIVAVGGALDVGVRLQPPSGC